MTPPVVITPRGTAIRHLWASLAQDLVMMTLPQSDKATAVTLPGILKQYELSGEDLRVLLASEEFQSILTRAKREAAELGRQAAHVWVAGGLAADLAKELYARAKNSSTPVGDVVKAYVALAKSAGLDEIYRPKDKTFAVNVGMGLSLNVPVLTNPKLDHLRTIEAQP
jgi:hypothetical protein